MTAKLKKLPWAFWLLAAVLWLRGGAKPPAFRPTVTHDEFFRDVIVSASTNDVHFLGVSWLVAADYLPPTANAKLSAVRLPDGGLEEVTNAPMSALALSARMPLPVTNYVWYLECDWVPSPSVITNGVYHLPAVGSHSNAVPVGASIRLVKGVPTARDYVRDGLVAMWDGIENAGFGVHDPNATKWVDLVSGQPSEAFQATEEVEDNAVITTTRSLTLMADVESVANGIETLTVQRVAQEIVQSSFNNMAASISFCPKRFGVCMGFRHVQGSAESGHGYGPMMYSFSPYYGSFGKGYYSPSDTYPLQSRSMIVGPNNTPISGYEGDYLLPAYGRGVTWGSASSVVSAVVSSSASGRYRHCCIRVYNRALSAAEIAANYEIDRKRFNLP